MKLGHELSVDKHEDFTVITIFDCTTRELVYIDRFNKIEYLFQIERLRVACELFRPKVIKIDRLGNDAVCEFLATCKYPDTTTDKDTYFPRSLLPRMTSRTYHRRRTR